MRLSIYRCGYLFIDAAIYKIDFLKFNLLSKGLIEKFWDALWLGIGPFSCFICKKKRFPRIQFAVERSNREILGRLVARYWAAFVFDLINQPEVGGGNPWTMVTSDDFLPRSQSIP